MSPPKVPPTDRRHRMEVNNPQELNEAIRKGDWELYKTEADSIEGFTYILVERKKDKPGSGK